MNNRDYHADTSRISKSGLDLMAKSPAHYYARYLDPNRAPQKETEALIAGRVIHSFILEPHKVADEYCILPELNMRTNDGKAQYQQFLADNQGRMPIDIGLYDNAQRIKDAVYKNQAAAELLRIGVAERTILFQHPESGAMCKCRPDWETPDGFIVDIKSTEDASPEAFARSAFKYRYHVQSAFYSDGFVYDKGYSPEGFVFIAVEKTPPYGVGVYFATNDVIGLGRDTYVPELFRYQACVNTGRWPAYSDQIEDLKLPGWAYKK
jgi:exodeoxyribonuclease VIII